MVIETKNAVGVLVQLLFKLCNFFSKNRNILIQFFYCLLKKFILLLLRIQLLLQHLLYIFEFPSCPLLILDQSVGLYFLPVNHLHYYMKFKQTMNDSQKKRNNLMSKNFLTMRNFFTTRKTFVRPSCCKIRFTCILFQEHHKDVTMVYYNRIKTIL